MQITKQTDGFEDCRAMFPKMQDRKQRIDNYIKADIVPDLVRILCNTECPEYLSISIQYPNCTARVFIKGEELVGLFA